MNVKGQAPWSAVIMVAAALTAAGANKPEREVIKAWPSPDGRAKAIWERVGPLDGDTEQYALTLIRPGAKPVKLEAFWRAVNLMWSADSKTIVFTDYIGSNVADCYVVDADEPAKRVDIAGLVPNLPKLRDAHVYVTCQGWKSPNEIDVSVAGRMDFGAFEEFEHRYVYDLSANRLRPVNENWR